MNYKVSIIDPAYDLRWDQFVLRQRASSLYHHSLWKSAVQNSFGYQPQYFVVEDGARNIVGGAPFFFVKSFLTGRRLISLSFADYADVLLDDHNAADMLLSAVVARSRQLNAAIVEFRERDSPLHFEKYEFEKTGTYKNHVLMIDAPLEEIRTKRIRKSYRQDINNGQKNKLQVVFGSTLKDMGVFYNLYVETRKRCGLPPMPLVFFKNIWHLFHPNNMLVLMFALDGTRPIAGMLLLKFKKTLYALQNSSERRFWHKSPNHLLWWKSIEIASEEGLDCLDFGRTATDNVSLISFKRAWGTEERDINHFTYGNHAGNSSIRSGKTMKRKLLKSVCKITPGRLLAIGSSMVYKHLG